MIAPILPLTRDLVGQCRSSAEREREFATQYTSPLHQRERKRERGRACRREQQGISASQPNLYIALTFKLIMPELSRINILPRPVVLDLENYPHQLHDWPTYIECRSLHLQRARIDPAGMRKTTMKVLDEETVNSSIISSRCR